MIMSVFNQPGAQPQQILVPASGPAHECGGVTVSTPGPSILSQTCRTHRPDDSHPRLNRLLYIPKIKNPPLLIDSDELFLQKINDFKTQIRTIPIRFVVLTYTPDVTQFFQDTPQSREFFNLMVKKTNDAIYQNGLDTWETGWREKQPSDCHTDCIDKDGKCIYNDIVDSRIRFSCDPLKDITFINNSPHYNTTNISAMLTDHGQEAQHVLHVFIVNTLLSGNDEATGMAGMPIDWQPIIPTDPSARQYVILFNWHNPQKPTRGKGIFQNFKAYLTALNGPNPTDAHHAAGGPAMLLAHEIGHVLDLGHTYSGGGTAGNCTQLKSSDSYYTDVLYRRFWYTFWLYPLWKLPTHCRMG